MKQHRISALLDTLPQAGGERFSAGKGSKGERYYDWLCCDLNAPPVQGSKREVLIRCSISSPKEVRAFICFSPKDTSVQKLAQIAGTRWTVERSFAESKGEVGLDHYEVRSYSGWYKHITLACCAHALLTVLKSKVEEDHAFQHAVDPEQSQSLRAFKRGRSL